MKHNKLLLSLIALLVIVGGYFVWTNYGDEIIPRISPTPTLPPEPTTPTNIGVLQQPEDLSNWKQSTTGDLYSWTFKYPASWIENSNNMDHAFSYIPNPRLASYGITVDHSIPEMAGDSLENMLNLPLKNDFYHVIKYEVGTLPITGNRVFIIETVEYATSDSLDFKKGDRLGVLTNILIEGDSYRYYLNPTNSKCTNNGTLIFSTWHGHDSENNILTSDPYFDTLKQIASTVEFLPCTD